MADDIKTIVTARAGDGVASGYASTPGTASPNYFVQALSPLRLVVTRVVRVYLQSVLGIVSAGMGGLDRITLEGVPVDMLPNEFGALFLVACKMSVAIGGYTALQNIVELAAKLDQTAPELRA